MQVQRAETMLHASRQRAVDLTVEGEDLRVALAGETAARINAEVSALMFFCYYPQPSGK